MMAVRPFWAEHTCSEVIPKAPRKSAPVRFAPSISAPRKTAPVKLTPRKSAFFKSASKKIVPLHRAPVRLAFSSRAEERSVCSRSEEHTSELQSPDHLVCRLLLEKKKKTA